MERSFAAPQRTTGATNGQVAQSGHMRTIALRCLVVLSIPMLVPMARADDALYRCESAAGISIQSTPCPKGVEQKKINFQRPADVPAPPPRAAASGPAPAPALPARDEAPLATIAGHPVTPPNAIHGPNDPYPLWQCMRGDGSTYDSRDGIPGRQWVVAQPAPPDASAAPDPTSPEAQKAALVQQMKKTHGVVVRPYGGPAVTVAKDSDSSQPPPPPGAGPGQWVSDQCEELPPEQACKRYAVRRDALRRQIYAAKPDDRSIYAPEEQDLTSMLYATCGM
ncbi:MAG TPA: hypothetical protein VGH80_15210 [Xanthomonadaceae bacterium]|jgi:hypothetical protein